jgi:hypothetical protein
MDFERIEPELFLAAMVESFHGRKQPLENALHDLIRPIG